jgi:hypothetical protein
MHHRQLGSAFASALLVLLAACEKPLAGAETSSAINRHLERTGRTSIDLAKVVPGDWEKVCVLGPYTDNAAVRDTIGFDWDAQSKTSMFSSDGASLLLFVRGQDVVEYVEHPRWQGDFSNLTGRCFPKNRSIFVHSQSDKWRWFIPK